MSASQHPHHDPALTTEEATAGVNVRTIVTVGAVALVVFALSALIAWFILGVDERRIASQGEANATPLMGAQEIGIVDFVPFAEDLRVPEWRAKVAQSLQGYSWVDRASGKVRLPIEVGMKKAIAEAASGKAIGESNATVAHEPDVPLLRKADEVARPVTIPSQEGPVRGSPGTPIQGRAPGEKDPTPPGGRIQQ